MTPWATAAGTRAGRTVLLAASAVAAGCGQASSAAGPVSPGTPSAPVVTTVTVSGAPSDSVLLVGNSVQLTATGRLSNGQSSSEAATWASSNTGLATVTTGGLAQGVGVGTVQVRATMGGVTGQATLLVRAPAVSQGVALTVGSAPTVTATVGQDLSIPVALDFTNAPSGSNVASVQYTLSWDPAKLGFRSGTAAGNGWFTTVNTAGTTSGTIVVSAFSPTTGTTASLSLYSLVLTARAAGSANVSASSVVGGSSAGTSVTLAPRSLSVTITP